MTIQEINELSRDEVRKLCGHLHLDTNVDDEQMRRYLLAYFRFYEKEKWVGEPLTMHGIPKRTTDGLLIYRQEGVGLVVSAAEHNFKLSEWQAREADLMRVLSHAEESSQAHQDRVAELQQPSAAEQWNPDVEINHYKAQIALLVEVGNRLAKEAFERGCIDRVEEWDHTTSNL